jgi:GPH family glycoside/pentoside/hexuronide:cation symporter
MTSRPGRVLSTAQLAAYAFPSAVASLMIVPLTAVIPTLYEKYYAISFAAIGLMLTVSRLFDAIIDPAIAYLSDKTTGRLGARKPWLIGGSLISLVGCWYLFAPSGKPDAAYLLIWSTVVYLGWTMLTIPYNAWGAEISGDYRERSSIVTWAGMVGSAGSILFFAAPIFLPFKTENITPEVLRLAGIAILVLIPISTILAVWLVPAGKAVATVDANLWKTARGVLANKPFKLFLVIFVVQGFALGIYATLLFAFVDGYLKIGEHFARIIIVVTIANFVSTPAWLWAANRWGKHVAWAIGSASANLMLLGYLFVPIGPAGYMPMMLISFAYGLLSSCATICYPSILADVIDYGTLKTGSNRAGSYFAVTTLIVKGTAAFGGGLATALIGAFGFSTKVEVVNTPLANFGMLFTFVGIHTVLQMIAIPLIWRFPLNQRNQATIRKRIEQRAERALRSS